MKITPNTTLAELEVARMQLGITAMLSQLKTRPDGTLAVEVMLVATDGIIEAQGTSIPEAIANAFELRQKQIADLITGVRQ